MYGGSGTQEVPFCLREKKVTLTILYNVLYMLCCAGLHHNIAFKVFLVNKVNIPLASIDLASFEHKVLALGC